MTAYIEEDEIRKCLKIIMEGGSGYFGQRDPYTDLMKRVKIEPFLCAGTGAISENKKEENTMKVSYKGVTGELVRLERVDMSSCICATAQPYKWEMDIWDNEKRCKVSFPGVSLKDVRFLGGEVSYG